MVVESGEAARAAKSANLVFDVQPLRESLGKRVGNTHG